MFRINPISGYGVGSGGGPNEPSGRIFVSPFAVMYNNPNVSPVAATFRQSPPIGIVNGETRSDLERLTVFTIPGTEPGRHCKEHC